MKRDFDIMFCLTVKQNIEKKTVNPLPYLPLPLPSILQLKEEKNQCDHLQDIWRTQMGWNWCWQIRLMTLVQHFWGCKGQTESNQVLFSLLNITNTENGIRHRRKQQWLEVLWSIKSYRISEYEGTSKRSMHARIEHVLYMWYYRILRMPFAFIFSHRTRIITLWLFLNHSLILTLSL